MRACRCPSDKRATAVHTHPRFGASPNLHVTFWWAPLRASGRLYPSRVVICNAAPRSRVQTAAALPCTPWKASRKARCCLIRTLLISAMLQHRVGYGQRATMIFNRPHLTPWGLLGASIATNIRVSCAAVGDALLPLSEITPLRVPRACLPLPSSASQASGTYITSIAAVSLTAVVCLPFPSI